MEVEVLYRDTTKDASFSFEPKTNAYRTKKRLAVPFAARFVVHLLWLALEAAFEEVQMPQHAVLMHASLYITTMFELKLCTEITRWPSLKM